MSAATVFPRVAILTMIVGCGDKELDEDDDGSASDSGFSSDNSGWYDSGDLLDEDGDGYIADEDCNDLDPDVNPGQTEICDNEVDDNCDGLVDTEDTEACPEEGTGTAALSAAPAGLDWQLLEWCAPEGQSAGLPSYRRAESPFLVGQGEP